MIPRLLINFHVALVVVFLTGCTGGSGVNGAHCVKIQKVNAIDSYNSRMFKGELNESDRQFFLRYFRGKAKVYSISNVGGFYAVCCFVDGECWLDFFDKSRMPMKNIGWRVGSSGPIYVAVNLAYRKEVLAYYFKSGDLIMRVIDLEKSSSTVPFKRERSHLIESKVIFSGNEIILLSSWLESSFISIIDKNGRGARTVFSKKIVTGDDFFGASLSQDGKSLAFGVAVRKGINDIYTLHLKKRIVTKVVQGNNNFRDCFLLNWEKEKELVVSARQGADYYKYSVILPPQ